MVNVKYVKASLDAKNLRSEIEFIKFNQLYVCMDKTKGMPHLVYSFEDFTDEVKRNGYDITTSEITLPFDTEAFNELEFSYYEMDTYDLYLFRDLAIKADRGGLETFCKDSLTVDDILERWELPEDFEAINEASLSFECRIPKNKIGELAVKFEKLQYDLWDLIYRCPGETQEPEDRLDCIKDCYETLSNGDDLADALKYIKDETIDAVAEYTSSLETCKEEDKGYYLRKIKNANNYLNTADVLMSGAKAVSDEIRHGEPFLPESINPDDYAENLADDDENELE